MSAYSHLNECQREIIALRHSTGVSQTEIAREIGCHKSRAYICHEAIYAFIYAASQASEKRWQCLVRRRKKHKPRTAKPSRGRIANRVSIDQRPDNIENRSEFGHWEADYMICKTISPCSSSSQTHYCEEVMNGSIVLLTDPGCS